MDIEKILVTPSLAKLWLETRNEGNRNVNENRVTAYVNEITKGNWKEDTGELIKFSKEGRLLDGQHRLKAVFKSGVSVAFHIAKNLEDSVFQVIDTGKPRGGSDAMKIAGIKHYTQLSSIMQKYNLLSKGMHKGGKGVTLSNTEIINLYNSRPNYWNEKVIHSVRQKAKFNNIISTTLIGGFSAVFDEKDLIKSISFFEELCYGKQVTNNTVNLLRDKLIQKRISKTHSLSLKSETAYIIKAWNAYRLGKEFKILKFDENIENFPTII
jgi:hypothetical protein